MYVCMCIHTYIHAMLHLSLRNNSEVEIGTKFGNREKIENEKKCD